MHKIVFGLVLVFCLEPTHPAAFKFTKLECNPELKYVANATCKLKAINRYKAVANMDCDFINPLRNISLHMQLLKKNDVNQYKPYLINMTFNVCDALSSRNFHLYTRVILNILRNVSSADHPCPYAGHFFAKNLYVDQKHIPLSPPLGVFKAVFRFLEGYPYVYLGSIIFYLEIFDIHPMEKN